MSTEVLSLWTIEEVDEELERCSSLLRDLRNPKARRTLMKSVNRLLDRRRMLMRCRDTDVELGPREKRATTAIQS